jgi:hypothetical protein
VKPEPPTTPAQLAWVQALWEPQRALRWSLADWEHVVRLARRLRLLARLAVSLENAGLIEQVPALARRHLLAERRLSAWRTQAMIWALDRVGATLGDSANPKVLLKGAAYLGQGLSIARGRLPSDVDILVPKAHLAQAQTRLLAAGWQELELDEHDQRYYREWSHELPPMRHPQHRIELDLHHNILPPVARTHVDADQLLARLQPTSWPGWQVLHPVDQVLHSASHLFLDSEARDRVRDLIDLDGLLRHFGVRALFWDELVERAQSLGLVEPLALACHFCTRWLGTPVPGATLARVVELGPSRTRRMWLLPLIHQILNPAAPDQGPPWRQELARGVFLARYHRNRMALRLLLPHLWHKLRPRALAVEAGAAEIKQE